MSTANFEPFVQLRRDIHQHPELAYEEHRTSELVTAKLRQWGYEVTTGLGRTGVVGQLIRGSGKRRIGLRADMDALPIQEATGVPWESQAAGVMHACGHDGHTAMLLAAAKHIAEEVSFDGTLNLIFQPAEEGGGGALSMMADGLFERFPCDSIFAMHNMPGFEQGELIFRAGPTMASSDYVSIVLECLGGHGAMPHQTTDSIVAAASVIMALQTVVSRHVDPLQPAVVTVGAIHAGRANNVIPASAELELSVRTLDPAVRQKVKQRLHELVHAQAASFGVKASIDWRDGYTVLVNDAEQTRRALDVARKYFDEKQVNANGPVFTGSEDFAFMLERIPGCYFFEGNGKAGEPGACMVHNPAYDFNDGNISIGATFWISLVRELLSTCPNTTKETS